MVEVSIFNQPEMVEFIDKLSGEVFYGTGFGDGITCGFLDKYFALDEVEIVRLIPWTEIIGAIKEGC